MSLADNVRSNTIKNVINLHSEGSVSSLELCRIDKVNCDDFTVRAYFFISGVTRDNVGFCSPYVNLDKGFVFMPEEGSLAVAFWAYKNEPIIVAFLNPVTRLGDGKLTKANPSMGNFTPEPLNEGEFIISSSGRSFIKGDMSGSILISTPLFNFLKLDGILNTLFLNSENLNIFSEASTLISGIAKDSNGEFINAKEEGIYLTENIERIYEESDNTINLNIDDIPKMPETLEIQKGNVFDIINGERVKISSSSSDLCFRIVSVSNEANVFRGSGGSYAILAEDSSSEVGYYNGWCVEILNDIPKGIKGHVRVIESYDEFSKIIYINEPWSILPSSDTAYRLYKRREIISADRRGTLFLGNSDSAYKSVARLGDEVTINLDGVDYKGVISSGSPTVLVSG